MIEYPTDFSLQFSPTIDEFFFANRRTLYSCEKDLEKLFENILVDAIANFASTANF
ncbi:MAG: hypothetical protein HC903_05045 [Methylacidiphilales bacterium]|nr:hypothetical protein [Candidatus Methylacidiphilales bacterium]